MTKIFADGADLVQIKDFYADNRIEGFTTNPTLMNKAGVKNYERFAKELLGFVTDVPISFEVFANDEKEIYRQAKLISSWGENVYVKIPVTTTNGLPLYNLIGKLSQEGIKINATAVFTVKQTVSLLAQFSIFTHNFISVFAGRIADTGIDPTPILENAIRLTRGTNVDIIWASPREVLNYAQAIEIGCDVITMTPDLIAKLDSLGKSLEQFSLETVQMFYKDGQEAGYKL